MSDNLTDRLAEALRRHIRSCSCPGGSYACKRCLQETLLLDECATPKAAGETPLVARLADAGADLMERMGEMQREIDCLRAKLAASADAGCGCRTSEQTGTSNGYSCNWHRERYVAELAAARADADARVQAAVQERDKVWREAVEAERYIYCNIRHQSTERVAVICDAILSEVTRRLKGGA